MAPLRSEALAILGLPVQVNRGLISHKCRLDTARPWYTGPERSHGGTCGHGWRTGTTVRPLCQAEANDGTSSLIQESCELL